MKGIVTAMKVKILYILLGIFVAAVIVSAVGLGYELYIIREGQAYYTSLTDKIEPRPRNPGGSGKPAATPPQTQPPEGADPPAEGNGGEPEPEQPQWVPYVDFEALGDSLPGITAWIKLDNTALDYPVMQWTNNSFFLQHLPDGTKHRNGSLFIDYRNAADFSDRNTLIYGHESRTGDMFGILKSYRKQSFFEENPAISLYTPEKDYRLVLVAGYLVDSGIESPPIEFRDETDFMAHIAKIQQRSFFKSDVEVNEIDRIVSLCTCAYDYVNARLVIVGKLVEY